MSVIDPKQKNPIVLGKVKLFNDVELQPGYAALSEYVGSIPSCADLPYARVSFENLTTDGSATVLSRPQLGEECKNEVAINMQKTAAIHEIGAASRAGPPKKQAKPIKHPADDDKSCANAEAWKSSTQYRSGDKVLYENLLWKAKRATREVSPNPKDTLNPWAFVTPCS